MATTDQQTCVLLHAGASYRGKQGIDYSPGISAESAGSKALCLMVLDLPPGGRAKAHLHANHETAIYVLSGSGVMLYGDDLGDQMKTEAGDYIYIPAGVPHLPINTSETEHMRAVVARTDPNEQESVVLLPELDGVAAR
jgi:uncharacterized RmlC-like cupin family protein